MTSFPFFVLLNQTIQHGSLTLNFTPTTGSDEPLATTLLQDFSAFRTCGFQLQRTIG
jgi:hypothetical protein